MSKEEPSMTATHPATPPSVQSDPGNEHLDTTDTDPAAPRSAPHLAAAKRHLEDAYDAVQDMCNGSRRWRMSVPVDWTHDHDVRITVALNDLRHFIEEAER